ncbi:MAG: hypothetical protein ABF876_05085 [Acetobacter aceti]
MSVKIPVQADVQGAIRSFDDVRSAIERAGQAGRQIADIDFSHPELQGMEDALLRIQKRWEELLRVRESALAGEARKRVEDGDITGPLDLLGPAAGSQVADGSLQTDQFLDRLRRILFSDEGIRVAPAPAASEVTPAEDGARSSGSGSPKSGPADAPQEKSEPEGDQEAEEGHRHPQGAPEAGHGAAEADRSGTDAFSSGGAGGPAWLTIGDILAQAGLRTGPSADEGLRAAPPPGASGEGPAGVNADNGNGTASTEMPDEADAAEEEAEAEGHRRRRGGASGGGGGDSGDGLDALSVIGGPARLAIGGILGAAGLRGGLGVVTSHMGDAEREMVSNDGLMRRVSETGEGFDELLHNVRAASQSIHVLQTEGQALTEQWVRITSETRGAAAAAAVTFAGGVARGFGVAPSLMTGGLAQARNQGEDPRHFAMLLGEAMHQGNMGGQLENVMQAMLRWTENANRLGYEHANLDSFAALYAGMNATGSPQLRGPNAENIIDQQNATLSAGGGGGLAGQVMLYQAARRHGVSDIYQWGVLRSQGMLARLPDGMTVRDAANEEIQQQYGLSDPNRRVLAGATLNGLTPGQWEAQSGVRSADLQGVERYLSSHGMTMEHINPTGIAGITAALDPQADLPAIRTHLLERQDLQGEDAVSLRAASTSDEIRQAIISTYAHSGMQGSMGQDIINANADLSNTLTNAASLLVGPVTALKDAVSSLNGPVQKIAEALNHAADGGYDSTLAAPVSPGIADAARDAGVDAAGGAESRGWAGAISSRVGNNPLNLMYNDQAGTFAGSAGHVARFDSLENGLAAAGWQLLRNQEVKGQQTVSSLVRGWDTSPEDAPKLPGYIADVGRRLGVDPYKPYSLRTGDNLERLEDAMAHDEVGHGIDDAGALRRGADRARSRDVNVHLHGGVVTVRLEDQHGNLKAQTQAPLTASPGPVPAGLSHTPAMRSSQTTMGH